ncbi:hypothetical protein CL634_08895 [bacterium]|nr:hypothetical protein [bacterium]|tara:strand:+ start:1538 stop:2146 length:609 start_codon:yes stop_codon:yes gene_type:complete
MKTEIKLSDQIEDNTIVDPKEEDLSKYYLSEKIIIVNDFVDEDDLGILGDCQVRNVGWKGFREGEGVLRKVWYADAIKEPKTFSNNPQFDKALLGLREKILDFAVNKFEFIDKLDFDATLRLSEIKEEEIHVDQYEDNPLRIFVNIDNAHRVWRTTTAKYDLKKSAKHEISFAPGTLWCCDTKKVVHQIMYGKRAVLFSFRY